MPNNKFNIQGLTDKEVLEARKKYGLNKADYKKEYVVLEIFKDLVKEPMVLLLLVASVIYFISGDTGDGIFLAASIVLVSLISLYQDSRSKKALQQLKTYTQPNAKVIRNGTVQEIKTEQLVPGDSMMVEEGSAVAADGKIIHSNDFSVNESILTGESMAVSKDADAEDNHVYQGTAVVSGLAIAIVTATGSHTQLGKIGKSIEGISEEKTPLEKQINSFVKKMVIVGVVVFLVVWVINFFLSYNLLDSLLKALTLAMSILPEEIPVAFTTFMALGAWRLMKMGIVVKQMKTVETLGSATVICADKTGTITENKMSLAKIYLTGDDKAISPQDDNSNEAIELIRIAMFASEPIPFDPMELALHKAYEAAVSHDERAAFEMIHEYPLGGKPPMMTHIFSNHDGKRIIAAKGAPEAITEVSHLSEEEKSKIINAVAALAKDGYRILGVGEADYAGNNFPEKQQDFNFKFLGLVAFNDPPKKNIKNVLQDFYTAGLSVKIVTGDNAATTTAIAKEVGFRDFDKNMTGDELMHLSDDELNKEVENIQMFTRMFPEAKLRIIDALKTNSEIVAMTGDGVNDGPALKAAHIGVAMGRKGTEIAKDAASLILADDDLSKMVDAIAMGRKIYTNLKKAIQYIISIHIPIILTVFLPLAFGWIYPNIFTPVHVIFLELIMGPTCSIIYENEPMEQNTMKQKPRPFTNTFFNWRELTTSIIQGLIITCGTLFTYQYAVQNGYSEAETRTMVFTTLIVANIFLTLTNRSFYWSIFTTIKYRNNLVPLIILITIALMALLLFVKPLTSFFRFETPGGVQLLVSIIVGFTVVEWYEIIKWIKRLRSREK